jgi:hypothetical protein
MTEPNEIYRDDHGPTNGTVGQLHKDEFDLKFDQECVEFQAQMPERIGAGEDLQTYPHMLTCERCRSLVRDLEYIAEAARQLIPIEEEPHEDLWNKIQMAIESGEA